MKKVAPSVLIREELDRLLHRGVEPGRNLISELVAIITRLVVQELLEGEQTDFLGGRGRYEPREEPGGGMRNGYEPGQIRTAEGSVDVRVPQVRDAGQTYRSTLMGFLEGNSEVLEGLVAEMYARGLSTRDVEDAFRDATGQLLLSKSAVTGITDRLWEQYESFCARDLSEIDVQYVFADAIFESLRRWGAKEAVLVCWGIDSDGFKHLLGVAVGNKESEQAWTEFFRGLVNRGLRAPTTVTADGAPGLINAIEAVWSDSLRIRCWFHRLGNIRAKLPDHAAADVMAHVRGVRDAATIDAARAAADRAINRFSREYPAAMACLAEDLDALLAIHRLPPRHRITARTTNLAERSFVEERRRTKVIPRLGDERSAMKLIFATLIRCAERWSRVSISDLERRQLRLLRSELGVDPPPTDQHNQSTEKKTAA